MRRNVFLANCASLPQKYDWMGFLAYSYPKKLPGGENIDWMDVVARAVRRNPAVDVIAMLPSRHNMYMHAEAFHPGFMRVWVMLLIKMNIKQVLMEGTPMAFYCNYWIARRSLVEEYTVFATRAMILLESDPELVALVNRDADYRYTPNPLPTATLQQVCGRPYYTFHAFVMERLPCMFFLLKRCNIVVPDAFQHDGLIVAGV